MSRAPQQPPLPADFIELDFAIVEEHWNEYQLSDGNRIKGRIFLRKLVMDPNDPNNLIVNLGQPSYSVYAPPENRGERNNEPRPEEYGTLPQVEIRSTNNNEHFNIYRILRNGQTVRVRLTVARITRLVDRFDKDGIPFYLINAGPMFIADPPPPRNQGQ